MKNTSLFIAFLSLLSPLFLLTAEQSRPDSAMLSIDKQVIADKVDADTYFQLSF